MIEFWNCSSGGHGKWYNKNPKLILGNLIICWNWLSFNVEIGYYKFNFGISYRSIYFTFKDLTYKFQYFRGKFIFHIQNWTQYIPKAENCSIPWRKHHTVKYYREWRLFIRRG